MRNYHNTEYEEAAAKAKEERAKTQKVKVTSFFHPTPRESTSTGKDKYLSAQ